jgi:hypothetical protein
MAAVLAMVRKPPSHSRPISGHLVSDEQYPQYYQKLYLVARQIFPLLAWLSTWLIWFAALSAALLNSLTPSKIQSRIRDYMKMNHISGKKRIGRTQHSQRMKRALRMKSRQRTDNRGYDRIGRDESWSAKNVKEKCKFTFKDAFKSLSKDVRETFRGHNLKPSDSVIRIFAYLIVISRASAASIPRSARAKDQASRLSKDLIPKGGNLETIPAYFTTVMARMLIALDEAFREWGFGVGLATTAGSYFKILNFRFLREGRSPWLLWVFLFELIFLFSFAFLDTDGGIGR